jgi:hypothetical protein
MIQHVLKAFLFTAVVLAVPLAAEDTSSIQSALAGHNYDRAIVLTRQAFANIKTAKAATELIHSIVAATPSAEVSALVVAAIEGNPGLAQTILAGAVEGVAKDQVAAFLAGVYTGLARNPNPTLVSLASQIAGNMNQILTMPTFNPANAEGVGVTLSPSTPGSRP